MRLHPTRRRTREELRSAYAAPLPDISLVGNWRGGGEVTIAVAGIGRRKGKLSPALWSGLAILLERARSSPVDHPQIEYLDLHTFHTLLRDRAGRLRRDPESGRKLIHDIRKELARLLRDLAGSEVAIPPDEWAKCLIERGIKAGYRVAVPKAQLDLQITA